MIDGLTLGAYAIVPKREPLDGAREEEWYRLLSQIDGATGLEIPFKGALHPDGDERLARLLPSGWHLVVSLLPAAVAATRERPGYGLASDDDGGRRAAVADLSAAHRAVTRLREATGTEQTRAVHIHSAPRAAGAVTTSGESLRASLTEIGGWDWGTTRIVVEHCDALTAGQAAEKGFLSLDDEIAAVHGARGEVGTALGQAINWGRSAIEGRSIDTPVAQLTELVARGTLSGAFFSGASATGGPLGEAWKDVHNPIDTADQSSLMTAAEIQRSVEAIGDALDGIAYLGVKVQDPADSDDLEQRLAPLRATAAAVRAAVGIRP